MTQRWQYQTKAESLDFTSPDFGWFVQEPDVIRPPHQTRPGMSVLGQPPITDIFVSTHTNVVLGGNVTLYQSKAEGQPPIIPAFDWFHQQTDVIRPPHQTDEGSFVRGYADSELRLAADFLDVQEPNVIRAPHQVRPGSNVLVEFDVLPKIDWLVQEPTFARARLPIVLTGLHVLVEPVVLTTSDIDWLIAPPDVMRPKHQTDEGLYVRGYDDSELFPAFDWFHQQADVTRARHQTRPGLFTFVDFTVPIPPEIPDIDWNIQEPDVVRPRHQTNEGVSIFGAVPIIPTFDWFHQQADVTRAPHQVGPGLFAFVEFSIPVPPEVPDIDWNIQEPDVIRPRHQTGEGYFTRGYDDAELFPDFGWYVPLANVIRAPTRPEGFYVRPDVVAEPVPDFGWYFPPADVIRAPTRPEGLLVLGTPPIIPAFDWFHQQADVVRPSHQTRAGLYVFLLDIPPLVVPDFAWFQQQADVVRRPLRPLGLLAKPLLILAGPFTELVFVIRTCLSLSELEINRLLPDGSGFEKLPVASPDPSGYEATEDDCNTLSAFTSDDLPSPSGFTDS